MLLRSATLWLVGCLLITSLAAQGLEAEGPAAKGLAPKGAPRLVDCIEAPLLYLRLGADAAPGESAGASGRVGVQQLLADPAFDALLGSDASSASTGRSLALVRGVLGKTSGEIEIALTGVVPGVGQPLLVLRAQLKPDQAEKLKTVLAGGDTAQNRLTSQHRVLNGTQTYFMLGANGELAEGSGQQVELALVGCDLVVANDTTAIEELLEPAGRTAANRRVLSNDRRFVDLQRRIDAPVGSLMIFGDWARLGQRLRATSSDAVPALLLRWSGLGSAQSVMAVLSCDDSVSGEAADPDCGFTATVLLDFDHDAMANQPAGRRARLRRPQWDRPGINGWFASALSVPAKKLVRDLPGSGLGGLVLAVDLRGIAGRSRRGAQLLRHLRSSFEHFGLDFERNVLSRLGERGTVQLLFGRGNGNAATEIQSVYSVRARSKKAAGDLFTDLRRAAEQHGIGRVLSGRERPSKSNTDVLELRRHPGDSPTCVAVLGDTVLVAFDAATIDAFLEEHRRAARQRNKRNAAVGTAVQKIGGNDVTGLFDLDFTPWFDHFTELFAAQNAPIDLSGIPRRHVGYLDFQPHDGGVVLRICVLSSR